MNNLKLLLVGPFEKELDPLSEQTLRRIKENNSIILTGYVSDVRPYFAISDCLVFPSYREGFPNVVLQAGAMGLPAIVSDINGCNEIITDGLNGFVISPKDVNALVLAMKRMSFEYKLKIELGLTARSMVKERYEQNVLWSLQKAEYINNLMSTKRN
jgi:glycosyltransferase involved in cell wall biosynthesis